jgi:glycosyltransferase involved in cell wall biosynthesis
MNRLRLLFIGWGGHIHFQRWVDAFVTLGHDVHVIDLGNGSCQINSCPVWRLRSSRSRLALQKFEIRTIIALFRPDIIHAHWVPNGYVPALCGAKSLVLTAWGSDIYNLANEGYEHAEKTRTVLSKAVLITCDSSDLVRKLDSLHTTSARIEVVQWGVDRSVFRPNLDTSELRRNLGLQDGPVIFNPRQLGTVYNPDVALRAIPIILKSIPKAQFLFKSYITTPERMAQIKTWISELQLDSVVRILDVMPYDELPVLYNTADVVLSIASSDSTPMSLLEAMACGIPPVASNLPSIREWITSGENGVLVCPTNETQVAEGVLRCLTDIPFRKSAISKNLDLVKQKADHLTEMRKMERLYMDVLSEKALGLSGGKSSSTRLLI